jgi:hypothetical protein
MQAKEFTYSYRPKFEGYPVRRVACARAELRAVGLALLPVPTFLRTVLGHPPADILGMGAAVWPWRPQNPPGPPAAAAYRPGEPIPPLG